MLKRKECDDGLGFQFLPISSVIIAGNPYYLDGCFFYGVILPPVMSNKQFGVVKFTIRVVK